MTDVIVEDHGTYQVVAELVPEPMTERDIRAMYPKLNEQGVANYVLLANRPFTDEGRQLIAARRAADECLLQARIREGEPWKGDCLTHGVEDSMSHHLSIHPEASTD